MFDELDRLRESEALLRVLGHYARAGAADREAWQDRLMPGEDLPARELVKLHGELIAYGWIEQNTGSTPVLKPGQVACCYRITTAGQRAIRWARTEDVVDDTDAVAA